MAQILLVISSHGKTAREVEGRSLTLMNDCTYYMATRDENGELQNDFTKNIPHHPNCFSKIYGAASNFLAIPGSEKYPRGGGSYEVLSEGRYAVGNFSPAGDRAWKYQHPLVGHNFEEQTTFTTIIIGNFSFKTEDVNKNLTLCPAAELQVTVSVRKDTSYFRDLIGYHEDAEF